MTGPGDPRPARRRGGALAELALLVGVFVVVTAISVAAGAANLGTAATFGAIAFAATLVWVMLRR